jgi:hypothetical protein
MRQSRLATELQLRRVSIANVARSSLFFSALSLAPRGEI